MERFKANSQSSNTSWTSNLHSNMERFKGKNAFKLYWNDIIYIPIWRDLKLILIIFVELVCRHLHSNMERFKACLQRIHPMQIVNLHSNMERFKEQQNKLLKIMNRNLHSNMERFKACCTHNHQSYAKIYIPIWRDLKMAG